MIAFMLDLIMRRRYRRKKIGSNKFLRAERNSRLSDLLAKTYLQVSCDIEHTANKHD